MRKRLSLAVGAILLFAASARAQDPLKGNVELSMGGAFQSITQSFGGSSESYMLFNIPVRVGYFFTEGFEMEAEIIASFVEAGAFGNSEDENAYCASANASYNFAHASRVRPFLLAGVGVSDASLPALANTVLLTDPDNPTRTIFNLGGGFKSLIGSSGAIRVEYRMQKFPEDEDEFLAGYTSHTIQVGASLFFD